MIKILFNYEWFYSIDVCMMYDVIFLMLYIRWKVHFNWTSSHDKRWVSSEREHQHTKFWNSMLCSTYHIPIQIKVKVRKRTLMAQLNVVHHLLKALHSTIKVYQIGHGCQFWYFLLFTCHITISTCASL